MLMKKRCIVSERAESIQQVEQSRYTMTIYAAQFECGVSSCVACTVANVDVLVCILFEKNQHVGNRFFDKIPINVISCVIIELVIALIKMFIVCKKKFLFYI